MCTSVSTHACVQRPEKHICSVMLLIPLEGSVTEAGAGLASRDPTVATPPQHCGCWHRGSHV